MGKRKRNIIAKNKLNVIAFVTLMTFAILQANAYSFSGYEANQLEKSYLSPCLMLPSKNMRFVFNQSVVPAELIERSILPVEYLNQDIKKLKNLIVAVKNNSTETIFFIKDVKDNYIILISQDDAVKKIKMSAFRKYAENNQVCILSLKDRLLRGKNPNAIIRENKPLKFVIKATFTKLKHSAMREESAGILQGFSLISFVSSIMQSTLPDELFRRNRMTPEMIKNPECLEGKILFWDYRGRERLCLVMGMRTQDTILTYMPYCQELWDAPWVKVKIADLQKGISDGLVHEIIIPEFIASETEKEPLIVEAEELSESIQRPFFDAGTMPGFADKSRLGEGELAIVYNPSAEIAIASAI